MVKPFLMGGAMAAMMLWMLHERIMEGGAGLTAAAVGFVLAHVAVVAVVLSLSLIFPRIRRGVAGHRPSLSHVGGMALGMAVIAGAIHAVMHGGVI